MDESTFREQVKSQGYSEPQLIDRPANFCNEEHTHDFSASGLVIAGELSVVSNSTTTICRSGDTFSLASGIPHHEQYGPEGAQFLVARR
jgi:hypothetical protein